jgi:hypothetical protein
MWHLLIDIGLGASILALGILIGGTAAWYKGWDEGFREGYEVETKESAGGAPRSVVLSRRSVLRIQQDRSL